MDVAKIAKKVAPMLKYGDKPSIAKATKISIRSVYSVFEGHTELVREVKAIKILKAAIKLLQEKEAMTEELAQEIKELL
jgi:hypothetical protein